jgi:hypothetical protein
VNGHKRRPPQPLVSVPPSCSAPPPWRGGHRFTTCTKHSGERLETKTAERGQSSRRSVSQRSTRQAYVAWHARFPQPLCQHARMRLSLFQTTSPHPVRDRPPCRPPQTTTRSLLNQAGITRGHPKAVPRIPISNARPHQPGCFWLVLARRMEAPARSHTLSCAPGPAPLASLQARSLGKGLQAEREPTRRPELEGLRACPAHAPGQQPPLSRRPRARRAWPRRRGRPACRPGAHPGHSRRTSAQPEARPAHPRRRRWGPRPSRHELPTPRCPPAAQLNTEVPTPPHNWCSAER